MVFAMNNVQLLSQVIVILLTSNFTHGGYPSSYYAVKKYPYLPAPPGETPPCAKNGATYCEKVDTYPSEVISYLLFKYGQTYEQFVKNEKDQDFFLLSKTYGPAQYDHSYGRPQQFSQYSTIPSSYFPSPNYNHVTLPPNVYNSSYFPQDQQQRSSNAFNARTHPHYHLIAAAIPPILQSVWWNHRDRRSREASFPHIVQHRSRVRRQATSESQLCPVRSNFITPRAAMTNDGNWMFVVNMEDTSRYIQKVKSEICLRGDGSPCDGLCTVPPGFSASCTQKYVQKRLVALDGTGDRLRNDVFWFPHCCVCQVNPV